MKMILMYADANRLDRVRGELRALGAPGYSVVAVAEGAGRTGLHTGDRVHPGALVQVTVIAEDAEADRLFDDLVRCRDACGDTLSKLFLLPVERQA